MVVRCRVCARLFEPSTDDGSVPESLRGAEWIGSRCARCLALASRRVAVEAVARARVALAREILMCNSYED